MEILVGILNFFVGKLKRGVGYISRLTAGRLLILESENENGVGKKAR